MKYSPSLSENAGSLEGIETDKVFELGYSRPLDGLRGVAVLAVMAFNAHLSFFKGGYIGVDLFFVLSGFLITSLLVQEFHRTANINLRNFYYRRALRLLPALFVLMLFISAYAAILQPKEKAVTTWNGVLCTLFYVANWAQTGDAGIGALSHCWSLSVEEQFYLIWPLLLILLLKSRFKRWGILVTLGLMMAASFVWSALLSYKGVGSNRIYLGSDTRAGELLVGCLVALFLHWGLVPKTNVVRNALRFISILTFAFIGYTVVAVEAKSAFLYRGGFFLISVGTAGVIAYILFFPSIVSKVMRFRPLVWTGRISYGLYLWHFPIFEGSRQALENRLNSFVYQGLRFGAVFIVATASFYLLEKPFLKLKQRYSDRNALQRPVSIGIAPIELGMPPGAAIR